MKNLLSKFIVFLSALILFITTSSVNVSANYFNWIFQDDGDADQLSLFASPQVGVDFSVFCGSEGDAIEISSPLTQKVFTPNLDTFNYLW